MLVSFKIHRDKILLFLLLLILILFSYDLRTSAQTNSFTGTINDSSGCFLYLPGFATSWHPYDSVRFRVASAGSYSFNVSATTITNAVWFYLYEGSHDPLQSYNQASFLGVASSAGYNGGVVTANLLPGITYIMATNNDENFSTQAPCEARATTVSGSYTITSTGAIILPPFSSSQASVSAITMPPDDRINWGYGDLYAVLYRGVDDSGNPAINLYCWNEGSAALGLQVSALNVSDRMPAQGCDVVVYLLENGQVQFNIYVGAKRYEIECADFACATAEMRHFDPLE